MAPARKSEANVGKRPVNSAPNHPSTKTKNRTKTCGSTHINRKAAVTRFRSAGCDAARKSGAGASGTEGGDVVTWSPLVTGDYDHSDGPRGIDGSREVWD